MNEKERKYYREYYKRNADKIRSNAARWRAKQPKKAKKIRILSSEKVCTRCKKSKLRSEFRVRSTIKNGKTYPYHNPTCKICDSLIQQINYNKAKHDTEFKIKTQRRGKRWREANREIIKEKGKLRRSSEKFKAYIKAYNEKNRERIREKHREPSFRYHLKRRDALTDTYVVKQLAEQTKLKKELILKYPELIELKRANLLLKRQTLIYGKKQVE